MSKSTRTRKSKEGESEMSAADKFNKGFEAARAGQYYVRALTGAKLVLSGAARLWKKNPDYLYIKDLLLAGTEQEIRQVLGPLYAEDQIANAIEGAYRSGSEVTEEFKADVKSRSAQMPSKAKAKAFVPAHSAEWYVSKLEEAKPVAPKSPKAKKAKAAKAPKARSAKSKSPKSGKAKSAKSPKSKSPKSGKAKSAKSPKSKSPKAKVAKKTKVDPAALSARLRERLDKLVDGEVLDVSKYTTEGSGAVKIKTPSSSRSKKVVLASLKLASDSKVPLNMFLRHLGEDPLQYSDQWKAAKAAAKSVEAKSPKEKKSKSPAKRAKSVKKAVKKVAVSPSSDNLPLRNVSRPPTVQSSGRDQQLPGLPSARSPRVGSRAGSPRAASPRSPRSPRM